MREEAAEPEEQHHRRPLQQQLRGRLSWSLLPSSLETLSFRQHRAILKKLVLLHSSYRILCPECNKKLCFFSGVLSTRPQQVVGSCLTRRKRWDTCMCVFESSLCTIRSCLAVGGGFTALNPPV